MLSLCCPKRLCLFCVQVPSTLEIGLVPLLKGGQYPGLFLFSTPARMMRPVLNLATKTKELIGSFEQVEYIVGHNIEFGWGREGGGGRSF